VSCPSCLLMKVPRPSHPVDGERTVAQALNFALLHPSPALPALSALFKKWKRVRFQMSSSSVPSPLPPACDAPGGALPVLRGV